MKVKYYDIEMDFKIITRNCRFDSFMHNLGFPESLTRATRILTVKRALPALPTQKDIAIITNTIKEDFAKKNCSISDCHFLCYKSLTEKEIEVADEA